MMKMRGDCPTCGSPSHHREMAKSLREQAKALRQQADAIEETAALYERGQDSSEDNK